MTAGDPWPQGPLGWVVILALLLVIDVLAGPWLRALGARCYDRIKAWFQQGEEQTDGR